jgi:hypothetical protein
MDQRKAIFRAKLRETKEKQQQRRIDPALVRCLLRLSVSIRAFDLALDYLSEILPLGSFSGWGCCCACTG